MADKFIFIVVFLLMGIGLIFSYSLPIYLENMHNWGQYHFFIRFLIFSIAGILIMFFLAQCNPDKCIHFLGWGLLIGSGLLIILMPTSLLSPIVPVIKGARRWIDLGIIRISPIEFFKIGMIYFFAWSFSRKLIPKKFKFIRDEITSILPYLVILFIMAFILIIYQSDLGQTMLLFLLFIVMLIFTQVSGKTFSILILGGLLIFIIGIFQKTYRMERFKSALFSIYLSLPQNIQNMFDVQISTNDISYQIRQSLNAIYHGGMKGVGIGNGEIKLGFLSDVHTDFVLSGIAEETGFIGVLLVMLLLLGLIWRILKIANRIETKTHQDYVYMLFCVGVAMLIGIETALNALGIIGFFPLKGLPVPFVSYGGSAMIAFSVAVGMVLMISKKAKL